MNEYYTVTNLKLNTYHTRYSSMEGGGHPIISPVGMYVPAQYTGPIRGTGAIGKTVKREISLVNNVPVVPSDFTGNIKGSVAQEFNRLLQLKATDSATDSSPSLSTSCGARFMPFFRVRFRRRSRNFLEKRCPLQFARSSHAPSPARSCARRLYIYVVLALN